MTGATAQPPNGLPDAIWTALRAHTTARIALPRTGSTLALDSVLAFREDQAAARDAVRAVLDVDVLRDRLRALGEHAPPLVVRSATSSRSEYLSRPDLGRLLGEPVPRQPLDPVDLVIVLGDGLSAAAVQRDGALLYHEIQARCAGLTVAVPVIALGARVALGDAIAEAVGAATVAMLLGERPGLTVRESIGAYVTHAPRADTTDAQRFCVSNIHSPHGLSIADAAESIVDLVRRRAHP